MKGDKTQTTPLNFFLLKKKKKKKVPDFFCRNIESFFLFLKSTWLKLPIIETHVLQGTAFGLATVVPMANKTQREYFFNAVADHDAFFFSTRRQISAKLAGRSHRPCFSHRALRWILFMSFYFGIWYKHILGLNFNRILKCFLGQWGRNVKISFWLHSPHVVLRRWESITG